MYAKNLHTATDLPCHLVSFSTHRHTYRTSMSSDVPHMTVWENGMFWFITASPKLTHFHLDGFNYCAGDCRKVQGEDTHTHTHSLQAALLFLFSHNCELNSHQSSATCRPFLKLLWVLRLLTLANRKRISWCVFSFLIKHNSHMYRSMTSQQPWLTHSLPPDHSVRAISVRPVRMYSVNKLPASFTCWTIASSF